MGKMKAKGTLKEYRVIGRKLPTESEPVTPLYRMRIFATDQVVAKSRFWYFLRQLKSLRRLLEKLFLWKKSASRSRLRLRTLESGSATTLGLGPTTCTGSTGTSPWARQ